MEEVKLLNLQQRMKVLEAKKAQEPEAKEAEGREGKEPGADFTLVQESKRNKRKDSSRGKKFDL